MLKPLRTGAFGVTVPFLTTKGAEPWVLAGLTATATLVETHPMVDCASTAFSESDPKLTRSPPEFGVILYHCGWFRSMTMRVTGGVAENRLTRTPRTSPRLIAIPCRAGPGRAFGMSTTSRSGDETIWVCGA